MERADFSHSRHQYWTHNGFQGKNPSDIFKKHFMVCFTTPTSLGGEKRLAEGEEPRRTTSGDLMKIFAHHAKSAEEKKRA